MNNNLSIHFIPCLSESFDAGRAQGNGDVQSTVQIIVLVTMVGYLNEVFDDFPCYRVLIRARTQ